MFLGHVTYEFVSNRTIFFYAFATAEIPYLIIIIKLLQNSPVFKKFAKSKVVI